MVETLITLALIVIRVFVIFLVVMLLVPVLIWMERRVVAHMQRRIGPNRVGPQGLLQPIADAVKLILKEDTMPACADRPVFVMAPAIAMSTALLFFAVIPFNPDITIAGRSLPVQITDLNIGILYILAVSSIGVYAVVLGGWASQSKYPLLGGLRSAAQMISYELAMGLALVGVVMASGTMSMRDIVWYQVENRWFVIPQFVGFLVFVAAAIAELNRAPFDLPEAESELTGGFHTEYSSFKFAMFFMGEYVGMIAMGAVAATMFLGGWSGPILPGFVWFFIKVFAFIFFLMWLRATYPRVRYDQLMKFGWKVLIPVALLNILATGVYMALV
jgi:NADH-quinone oxidoreductase subunit H